MSEHSNSMAMGLLCSHIKHQRSFLNPLSCLLIFLPLQKIMPSSPTSSHFLVEFWEDVSSLWLLHMNVRVLLCYSATSWFIWPLPLLHFWKSLEDSLFPVLSNSVGAMSGSLASCVNQFLTSSETRLPRTIWRPPRDVTLCLDKSDMAWKLHWFLGVFFGLFFFLVFFF